jgi:hypothetical protein
MLLTVPTTPRGHAGKRIPRAVISEFRDLPLHMSRPSKTGSAKGGALSVPARSLTSNDVRELAECSEHCVERGIDGERDLHRRDREIGIF